MSHAKHHLIYSTDNASVGKTLLNELSGKGYQLVDFPISENDDSNKLNELQLSKPEAPIILLLTDNLLKSANSMKGALNQVKKWTDSGWLIPVIANGVDENGQSVPTKFERVTNIIPYMNHWQDRYLDLRKQKKTDTENPALDAQIKTTKDISSDMGELLRFLRNVEHYSLEEFQANEYAVIKSALGEETDSEESPSLIDIIEGSSEELMAENPNAGSESIPSPSEAEANTEEEIPDEILADIPGMDLLEKAAGIPSENFDPADDPNLDAEASSLMDELAAQQPSIPDDFSEADKSSDEEEKENEPAEGLLVESEDEELNTILDEVLAEEGMEQEEDEDFEFLPEDSDDPNDFNLDALLEDDDTPSTASGHADEDDEIEIGEDEIALDLMPDDEDEILEVTEGQKISAEEILEHALDLFAEGETKEGLSHLSNAVKGNPKNTTLRYYYAYAQARYAQDAGAAKDQLEVLLTSDPEHPEAWYLMGELAENKHDFEGAKKCFEKAVEINPDYPDIHYRLGLLTIQYFPKEGQNAANYFREAIRQNAENVDAHYALANLLNEQFGKPEEALSHFEKVIELEPDHHFANYDLALLHHKLENAELARQYYEKATAIDPDLKTEANDLAFGAGKEKTQKEVLSDDKLETKEEEVAAEIPEATPEPTPPGPVVLITGGTAGIGRATAEVFAREGYRVIITGRRDTRLEEIKNDFAERFSNAIETLTFDVRDAEAVNAAIATLPEEWQEVDILINNAGLSRGLAPIQEGKIEDWDTMIDTNVKGLLYLTRSIAPKMVARKSGHIINVASSAGKEVYPGGNVYCATKSAVEALTKSMRLDLFKHNVRVSQVAPGHVEETEFARVRFDWDEERAEKTYENFQPLKSSDVAEVIYFMATRPAHVNIQDIFMFGTQQAGSNFIDRSGR